MISRPLRIGSTWSATRETMKISGAEYGSAHHGRGKANAFRHAIWNYLICQKTYFLTKNEQKSVNWAKKITDLHEKMAKSDELDTIMDLHNNKIGRELFLVDFGLNKAELVQKLQNMLKNGQNVNKIEEIQRVDHELVFISE